ncbi:MAG: hypothetical protein AAGN46_10515 [Acidobacteriota bacterium]
MQLRSRRLAAFVTSHGFGHAARTCSVVADLHALLAERGEGLDLTIFSRAPRWFFTDSLEGACDGGSLNLRFVDEQIDLGLIQRDALREDLDATAAGLDAWNPLAPERVERLARHLEASEAEAVLCDISPVGLLAARQADRPSVLLENFTWTWIYRATGDPRLLSWADRLAPVFDSATLRLQAEPCCEPRAAFPADGPADPTTPPNDPATRTVRSADVGARGIRATGVVARRPRRDRATTRANLGIDPHERMLLVTMGGIPWDFGALRRRRADGGTVVVAGGAEQPRRGEGLVLLPHRGELYHPDLVRAADVVFAKLGYSTLAEVATTGAALAYVPRPSFAESGVLERWAGEHLSTSRISPQALDSGEWLDGVEAMLALPPSAPTANGAAAAARSVLSLLDVEPSAGLEAG